MADYSSGTGGVMLRYCDDLMIFPGSVLGGFRLGGPGECTGHYNSRLGNECMAAEAFPPAPLIPKGVLPAD